jgi:aldose 1-epimerase
MKFALCFLAFLVGCYSTVFVGSQPPDISDVIEDIQTTTTFKPSLTIMSTIKSISQSSFGTTKTGDAISRFTCSNSNGYSVDLINYGATVVALNAPDRKGETVNVTLGCTDMAGYEANECYLGATVGRYANRINEGKFSIDGESFALAVNNGKHHLHGGHEGFGRRVWEAETLETDDSVGVRFSLTSPDGDGGYPGELVATVDYILNNENELVIEYHATTDKPTYINLTNHSYWNLSGAGQGTIGDHELMLASDELVEVTAEGIPTGTLLDVDSTPFDFRTSRPIGEDIENTGTTPTGYDHCYVINGADDTLTELNHAATVYDPKSGRTMEVHTTQPGVQLYTCNWMDGQPASGGFDKHSALALESQHYPDSPNQADFPSTLLKPGEKFHHKTIYRFGVR